MPLSEKTRKLLAAPFAISPILQRFALPGLAGFLLFGIGAWQELDWLKLTGIVLAAPVIWAYGVLIFIYMPILLFDGIRRRLNKGK